MWFEPHRWEIWQPFRCGLLAQCESLARQKNCVCGAHTKPTRFQTTAMRPRGSARLAPSFFCGAHTKPIRFQVTATRLRDSARLAPSFFRWCPREVHWVSGRSNAPTWGLAFDVPIFLWCPHEVHPISDHSDALTWQCTFGAAIFLWCPCGVHRVRFQVTATRSRDSARLALFFFDGAHTKSIRFQGAAMRLRGSSRLTDSFPREGHLVPGRSDALAWQCTFGRFIFLSLSATCEGFLFSRGALRVFKGVSDV